jgi:flagellar basal body-associated protein FliL
MTKKWMIVSAVALAVMLALVAVLLVVVIGQNSGAAEQEDHDRIVAICEDTHGPMADNLDAVAACIADLKD